MTSGECALMAHCESGCYDGRMTICKCLSPIGCISHRVVLAVAVLLILVGCGRNPKPAHHINEGSTSATSPSSNDGITANNAPAAQLESRTESATPSDGEERAVAPTVFLEATLEGKIETVRQAIEAGMDVNETDEQQRTALLLAAFNGHTPVIKLLLEHGALLEHRDATGRTALMYAATGANGQAVRLLIEKGAEPNATDTGEGFTALMHASAEGQLEVVQILLQHGADSAITDVDGDTASDFASRNGHTEIVRLLTGPRGVN